MANRNRKNKCEIEEWQTNYDNETMKIEIKITNKEYLEIVQELEIQRAETMYWWRVLFTLLETFSGKVAVTNTIMQQTA